jgi:hypothetical protein
VDGHFGGHERVADDNHHPDPAVEGDTAPDVLVDLHDLGILRHRQLPGMDRREGENDDGDDVAGGGGGAAAAAGEDVMMTTV